MIQGIIFIEIYRIAKIPEFTGYTLFQATFSLLFAFAFAFFAIL